MEREKQIQTFYEALLGAWGAQNWWPAQSRFEVIVGAYLTQNTSWINVEHAMANLRCQRVLKVDRIREISLSELEMLVRPAGYYRQKAQRLKTFVAFLDSAYGGSLSRMFAQPTQALREQLLSLNGVGPETADSILLYAGNHPVFVVDAYTRRIVDRHGILPFDTPYEEIRQVFEDALGSFQRSHGNELGARQKSTGAVHRPSRISKIKRTDVVQRYNEMHALIVGVGKNHCFNKTPNCEGCPLRSFFVNR